MIKDAYSKELHVASSMVYERDYIGSFVYKLMNDRNVRDFLKSLADNAYRYKELERMEKYYFNSKLRDVASIMYHFIEMLEASRTFSDKSAEQIRVRCRLLNDSGGENVLYLLGHMPILVAIERIREAEDFFESGLSSQETVDEMKDFQRGMLFDDSVFLKRHPSDSDLVDYDLKAKKIEFDKVHFEKNSYNSLVNTIESVYKTGQSRNFNRDFYVECGMAFWASRKEKSADPLKLGEILTGLFDHIDNKRKQKISDLKERLFLHLDSIIDSKLTANGIGIDMDDSVSNPTSFTLTCDNDLSEYLDDICKITMIDHTVELYRITLRSQCGEKNQYTYVFDAKIHLK